MSTDLHWNIRLETLCFAKTPNSVCTTCCNVLVKWQDRMEYRRGGDPFQTVVGAEDEHICVS